MGVPIRKNRKKVTLKHLTVNRYRANAPVDMLGIFDRNRIDRATKHAPDFEAVPVCRNRWINQQAVFLRANSQNPVCGNTVQPLR